jgi:hypothetical protein
VLDGAARGGRLASATRDRGRPVALRRSSPSPRWAARCIGLARSPATELALATVDRPRAQAAVVARPGSGAELLAAAEAAVAPSPAHQTAR